MNAPTCTFCSARGLIWDGHVKVDPPMCAEHLDLSVLIEYLNKVGQRVTLENVQATLERIRAVNSTWTLTVERATELLPEFLAKSKNGSPHHETAAQTDPPGGVNQ